MAEDESPDVVLALVEQLAEALYVTQARCIALADLLVERGVLTKDEIRARMVAGDEAATLGVEFSDDPQYVEWRKLRRTLDDMRHGREEPGAERDEGGEAGA